MDCKIQSFNAYRAEKFGYKLSGIDRLIMRRSFLHTHTEIQFSERYGNISFSATMADGAKCCRFKDINYTKHPERWDTIIIPLTDNEEDLIYAKAKAIEGKPYDLIGLLSFISDDLNWIKPSESGYWCSEAVSVAMRAVKRIDNLFEQRPDEMHPTKLDTLARYFFKEQK